MTVVIDHVLTKVLKQSITSAYWQRRALPRRYPTQYLPLRLQRRFLRDWRTATKTAEIREWHTVAIWL